MSPELAICLFVLFALGAVGTPVALAMLASAITYLLAGGMDVGLAAENIIQRLYGSFIILAVPLFIIAAGIMNAGTISDRLLAFCVAVVGRFRGGLAYVNVLSSLIFSGMSGSAVADAAGVGKIVTEMMTRDGRYPAGFAAAVTVASATIGPIIPPSIPLVLYAFVSNTSIGYLFLAGIVPGLMMALALMILIFFLSRRRGFPVEPPTPLSALPRITFRAFPALLMPGILLWGIYGGATTPTEAAAIAATYALILATVVYRALSLRQLYRILLDSSRSSAALGLVVGGALIFNYIIASENIPRAFAGVLAELDVHPLMFLLFVNLVLLLLGCVLDASTIILVVVPVFIPTCEQLGIDLVHFGIVVVVNTMLGLITPPYGVLLFVINSVTGIPLSAIIREVPVFLLALIVALAALVLLPDLVLWLPRQLAYSG